MATEKLVAQRWVFARLVGGAGQPAVLGDRIYLAGHVEDETPPYVTVQPTNVEHQREIGQHRVWSDVLMLIKVHGRRTPLADLEAIATWIAERLHRQKSGDVWQCVQVGSPAIPAEVEDGVTWDTEAAEFVVSVVSQEPAWV